MAVITKTFRDFFNESYVTERVNEPRHFQTFYEMAMWKDIPKTPVNIDKEDIAFLHQFPHKYWAKALHMRYQMLFDAIEKRHKGQEESSQKLEKALKQAMLTQNWNMLQGIAPADEVAKLQQYFTRERVAKIRGNYDRVKGRSGADPIDEIAAKEAWQIQKDLNDHIEDPEGEVPFAIKTPDYDPETGKQIGSGKSVPEAVVSRQSWQSHSSTGYITNLKELTASHTSLAPASKEKLARSSARRVASMAIIYTTRSGRRTSSVSP